MTSRHDTRLAALANELAEGAAPAEIRLLPWGRFRATDGSGRPRGIDAGWLLDEQSAAALVATARHRAAAYAIDFEHQTLLAGKNGQPAPAAGWFKALEARPGDGLYATDVRWTARAAAMIAAGEYRYISPVFSYDGTGRVLALGPAALVNNPGLDGLTDLSRAALAAYFPEKEDVLMKELMKALGLAVDATEAQALAALAQIATAHRGELAALKSAAPDPAKFVEVATLVALQGEKAALAAELAALRAKEVQAEVDRTIADGLAAGKLTPATEPHARKLAADLAALKGFIDAQPVIVKPGDTQSGDGKPAGGGTGKLTAEQAQLAARMNIPAQDFIAALAA